MFNNIYKKFFILITLLLLLFLIFITFNTSFRKITLNSIINAYKVYMTVSMQTYLKKPDPDYALINKKLKKFINLSKKVSSGQSRLLIGIYDAANLVESSIIDDKSYGQLEEFFLELSLLDPNLYEAKVWYAKSLFANNKLEQSIKEIDKAIDLSPIDSGPYRLALKIFSNQNDDKKFNYYCNKYLKSEFGGKNKRYQFTKFEGFSFNDFAIRLKSEKAIDDNNYIIRGINHGKFDQYELIPEKSMNINSIEMIFNFNPGTVMEIENLKLFSKEKTYSLDDKDFLLYSKNAFFNKGDFQNQIIFTSYNNEILNLKLKKIFNNIDKIIFSIKFNKLNLVNKICQ